MIDAPPLVEIADNLARFRNFAWKPAAEDRYFQEQVLIALEALLRAQGRSAGTAETLQAAQAEGRQPGGEAMRPDDGRADKEKGAGQ